MALGKISAGLAHELNNPAAAVRRATDSSAAGHRFGAHCRASARQGRFASRRRVSFLPAWIAIGSSKPERIPLWTPWSAASAKKSSRHGSKAIDLPNAWDLAAALVDVGCERSTLEEVAKQVPPQFLADAFTRLTASFTISRLIEEIESGAGKISELVRAVKEYSYMDQMPGAGDRHSQRAGEYADHAAPSVETRHRRGSRL